MSTVAEKVEKAVDYIKKLDFSGLEVGKYPVDEDFYYMVQEYETKAFEDGKLEAHEKYIDIQWMISGTEKIYVCDVNSLKVKVPYNSEKDVAFYENPERMMEVALADNSYVVLYPENAHMPQIANVSSSKVRKIVVKVKM